MDAFRLSAEQNRTNRVDWVRLVRLSSIGSIEFANRTHRYFQFAYVRLPNQSNNDPADWVRLFSVRFRSISYPGWSSTELSIFIVNDYCMRMIKIWCFRKGVISLVTILTLFSLKMNFNPTFISLIYLRSQAFELQSQIINLSMQLAS